MQVTVNEECFIFDGALTLEQLLTSLLVESFGLALAVNQEIVPKSAWSQRILNDGDEIALFQTIAGG